MSQRHRMEQTVLSVLDEVDLSEQDLHTQTCYLTLESLVDVYQLGDVNLFRQGSHMSMHWTNPLGHICHLQIHSGLPEGNNGDLLFSLFQPKGISGKDGELVFWPDQAFRQPGIYLWSMAPIEPNQIRCMFGLFLFGTESGQPAVDITIAIADCFTQLNSGAMQEYPSEESPASA